jgi:hypothetical protein
VRPSFPRSFALSDRFRFGLQIDFSLPHYPFRKPLQDAVLVCSGPGCFDCVGRPWSSTIQVSPSFLHVAPSFLISISSASASSRRVTVRQEYDPAGVCTKYGAESAPCQALVSGSSRKRSTGSHDHTVVCTKYSEDSDACKSLGIPSQR